MPDTSRKVHEQASRLIARLRQRQLRSAVSGRVMESAKYALRASRVRRIADPAKAA